MKKIVSFGEIVVDRIHEKGILQNEVMGGAPLNMLLIAAQLIPPKNCTILSALGNDRYGEEARNLLEQRGVKFLIELTPQSTGTVHVEMGDHGVPSYDIAERVAYDFIKSSLEKEESVRNADAFCFGTLAVRNDTSRETLLHLLDCTTENCLRVFDVNLRQQFYSSQLLDELLRKTNILKVNDEEIEILDEVLTDAQKEPIEDACKRIKDKYRLDEIICTCGANGSYVLTNEGHSKLPSNDIELADTVGGGDAFTASYLVARLAGKPLVASHQLAVDVSGYVCTQVGGQPLLPMEFRSRI